MIDTHAHLQFPELKKDARILINRAKEAGVTDIIIVGSNLENSREAVELACAGELAQEYNLWATVGIHPIHADKFDAKDLKALEELAKNKKVIGIGEIGLDYYHNQEKTAQKELFLEQLTLADKIGLPVAIHSREAFDDIYEILKNSLPQKSALLHSFTGTPEQAQAFIKLGCFISFSGIVTFPNAGKIQEAAKVVPENKILIETDCPFLAPQEVRGQRNEPSFVKYVLQKLGLLRNTPEQELEKIIDQNTRGFFSLD